MRKFPFIWILILLMLRNIQVYAQFSGKGTGNISDPYLISNVKEFKEIENVEGDEYTYIYFRLVNDIDLAGECQEKKDGSHWFSATAYNLMEITKLSMD